MALVPMKEAEVLEVLNEIGKSEEITGFSDYYYWEKNFTRDYPMDIEFCKIAHPQNHAAQALTTVFAIMGILMNCGVLYVMIVLQEYKKTKQHWLVLHLFIANVLFLLFVFLEMVNEHHGNWVMGDAMCKLDESTIFASRSAGVLFLVISNLLGIVSMIGITFKWFPSCPGSNNNIIQTVKYAAVLLCVWLPSILVNLPLYRFKNVNDCGSCVLEFPIDISELCALLGLNPDACEDVKGFFNVMNVTALDSTIKGDFDFEYSSGNHIDTLGLNGALESNITEMAEMFVCFYEEPRSFFMWLLATFSLFFAIPMPILLVFLCTWIYGAVVRRQRKKGTILQVIFALDILFIICWMPWNVIHMKKAYGGLGKEGYYCASLLHFARLTALIYNGFSPIIYVALTKDFGGRIFKALHVSASFCYNILKTTEKPPPEPSTKLNRANSYEDAATVTTSVSNSNDSVQSPDSPAATPV